MTTEWVRRTCLSLPHTTEHVRWNINLVFKVGAKMFAILTLEPRPVCIAFKTSPEDFEELIERPGILPAPYLARAKWVALESFAAMPRNELESRLRLAYELVWAKLSKKILRDLS